MDNNKTTFLTIFSPGGILEDEIQDKNIINIIKELEGQIRLNEMLPYKYSEIETIQFLHEIPLNEVQQVLNKRWLEYQTEFPYDTLEDFKNETFGPYIPDILKITETNPHFSGYTIKNYTFLRTTINAGRRLIIYAIPSDKEFKYFKGYYKQLLEQINCFSPNINEVAGTTYEKEDISNKIVPQLRISNDTFNKVCKVLENYIEEDYSELEGIIKNPRATKEELHFNAKGVILLDLFARLKEYKHIHNECTKIRDWIYNNFLYFKTTENRYVNFSKSYTYDILVQKEIASEKSSIKLSWLPLIEKGK